MAVFILFGTLPFQTFAASDALSLHVVYEAKCGEPTTFTLNASGGTGQYLYYFNSISRVCEDGLTHVTDPSKQAQYQEDNTFQFTFCASGTYRLIFYVMDKGASPVSITRQVLDIVLNDPKYPTIETIADNVAKECMQKCDTDFDRALWLHDWLLDNCIYDYSYTYCGAEGAFARGTGTCETYHRAYTMLLNRVGIANGRIEGNGHVWTAVQIDGKWCQIDTTWDDNGRTNHSYENYLYFGLNDELTTMVHSDHSPNKGYESNSLDNHYFIKTGKIHQWSDPLMEPIQKYLQAEKDAFTVGITDSMPASYKNIIYNLAAYQLSSQRWETETQSVKIEAGYYNGVMQITASYSPIETEEEHSWDNGTVTKAATCTTDGVKTYTCTKCGDTQTETKKAKGHTVVTDKAVSATCTKAGKTAGSHCSVCNTVITKQETVKATGHSYDAGKVTKVPTATTTGIKTYTCTKCKATKTETIPKLKLSAPTLKVSVNSNGTFKMTWNKVTGAEKYEIYYKQTDGSYKLLKTVTGTSYTTVFAQYGKQYSYKMKAVTGNTKSDYSKVVNATNNKKLQTPTLKVSVNSNGTFKMTWNKVTGATSYQIYYKQADGSYKLLKTVTGTSYTSGFAQYGKQYSYKVRAVTSKNSSATSNFSSVVNAKNTNKLGTPTMKATVNKNGSFKLSWGKVTGATSYQIYWKQANGSYKLLKTVNGTSYTTVVAAKGKTYSYKVRAVTKNNSSATSNYSSVVSAKRK